MTNLFAFFFRLILITIIFSDNSFALPEDLSKAKELKILRITPDGADVPVGRQIVFQFNRAVVPLGQMERKKEDVPIKIEPELACEWRWLNTSALSCNLDEKSQLKAATSYKIIVAPGIKAEDGVTITNSHKHQFTTKRPDVDYASHRKWLSPSTANISLNFNQAVTKDSVKESIQIVFEEDQNKKFDILVEPDPYYQELPVFLPIPGTNLIVKNGNDPKKKVNEELTAINGIEARKVWLIKPVNDLPLNTAFLVKVKPGLVSALGKEKGIGDREVVSFHTFPEFSFLGIKCYTNEDDSEMILIAPGSGEQIGLCNPMRGAALVFNSPVSREVLKKNLIFSPPLGLDTETDPWGESDGNITSLENPHEKDEMYYIWLPAGVKANSKYSITSKSEYLNPILKLFKQQSTGILDEFNRPLLNPVNITFKTDNRKPNFEIIHNEAVLEKQTDSEVPLYVNNIKKAHLNYVSLNNSERKHNQALTIDVPKVDNIQFAVPFKVRELLSKKSGAIFGTLSTDPLVSKYPSEHRLFAEVTPYQVHVKLGHFNTLVWVTDLATGGPVGSARVSIYKDKLTELSSPKDVLTTGLTSNDGIAILDGTNKLDPNLDFDRSWRDQDLRLFVRVDKDNEMALLPIHPSFLIDSYRSVGENVYPENKERHGHIKTWGVSAQGIYRQGDVMQYKIYVRDQDNRTLVSPNKEKYRLQIIDPLGNKVFDQENLTLDKFGSYSGEYSIPSKAVIGWYQYKLTSDYALNKSDSYSQESEENKGKIVWYPLKVLVSDFTPSPFKVTNQVNGDLFHPDDNVEVSTQAKLHSGGAFGESNVRVVAQLNAKSFNPINPKTKEFSFGSYQGTFDQKEIFQKTELLDAKGELVTKFKIPTESIYYGNILIESSVQDDRGKFISTQSTASYAGVDRFVGLQSSSWVFESGKESALSYIVSDEKGLPRDNVKVLINIEKEVTKVSKVKGAGNTYLNEYINSWEKISSCDGLTALDKLDCKFTPNGAGRYRAIAKILDTKNKPHETEFFFYVAGSDYVEWSNGNDSSLEIIPEKTNYKVGETAKYLIKNPYQKSEALITIERYGVIDQFVKKLDSSTPIIEFEIKPDYLPGFYFSALVFSPRVPSTAKSPEEEREQLKNQIDLGKPSFKIGYSSAVVKDPFKEILVEAKADKEIYKPREKVKVRLNAKVKNPNKEEPISYAVTVLDESVLDLISGGKNKFDPYQGFYSIEGLDLRNYSLITRLIGRQLFEKKGANPGGDGGSDLAMRNIFKYVSYWNPNIEADASGNAEFEFEVPDNLTGFRVLAMAVTPTDRLGLGETNFKVNRPTEIRPAMPNQVNEGDKFQAAFTVMNRTDKKRDLKVNFSLSGEADFVNFEEKKEQIISLEPYKRSLVSFEVKAKLLKEIRNDKIDKIVFKVSAQDSFDGDLVEHEIPVLKLRSLETAAQYSSTVDQSSEVSIKVPTDIFTDVGSLSASLSPTIIGNIEGAFKYMRDYPYACWEQRLTKGVMASHYVNLKSYLPESLTWDSAKEVTASSIIDARNFQAPNGGMSYYIPSDIYVDPYLSAYTALAFNWLEEANYKIPTDVKDKLHQYLLNLIRENIMPDFYSKGMASTVRAVALAALSKAKKIDISDIERYRSHVPQMSLLGKAYFAAASASLNDGNRHTLEVLNLILAHSSESSGKTSFNEELDDSYSRILSTPLRENCAILSVLLGLEKSVELKNQIGELPSKLVRMITQSRKNRDHWENTQENMFCMNSIVDYAKEYEKVVPSMTGSVSFDSQEFGKFKFASVKDEAQTFIRPIIQEDLGVSKKLEVKKIGDGRLYYQAKLQYAPKKQFTELVNSGIEIRREYSVERNGKWELLSTPMNLKKSEIVRVDLFLSLPTARNFVVVNDPVPGSFEPINSDLATSSVLDASKGNYVASGGSWYLKFNDWISYNFSRWSFYHKEVGHSAVRFYSDYLSAGNYHLSYTAQVIAEGEFSVSPAIAEEMYDADIYGKTTKEEVKVLH